MSYPAYRVTTTTPESGCYSCHDGFYGRGDLHSFHVGSTRMTSTCTLCHTSTGDIPKTNSSGTDPGHGCNGCHMGPGLRAHHAAAQAPADAQGLHCVDCHDNDPPPASEATLPPYYTRTDVRVKDPCLLAPASGGEDWSGNGKGLDNDGDLAYDQNDSDCSESPTTPTTWGRIKVLYR